MQGQHTPPYTQQQVAALHALRLTRPPLEGHSRHLALLEAGVQLAPAPQRHPRPCQQRPSHHGSEGDRDGHGHAPACGTSRLEEAPAVGADRQRAAARVPHLSRPHTSRDHPHLGLALVVCQTLWTSCGRPPPPRPGQRPAPALLSHRAPLSLSTFPSD